MLITLLVVLAIGAGFNVMKYLYYSDYSRMPLSIHALVVEARGTHVVGAVWDTVWFSALLTYVAVQP